MTTAYSVIRVITNSSDQMVTEIVSLNESGQKATTDKIIALSKYHEVLADAVVKANSGRLADGAYLINNLGGIEEKMMFNADTTI